MGARHAQAEQQDGGPRLDPLLDRNLETARLRGRRVRTALGAERSDAGCGAIVLVHGTSAAAVRGDAACAQ
jgi:hypothetical protein